MTLIASKTLSFDELCLVTELPNDTVLQIVEHGIIEPRGNDPREWTFEAHMVIVTRKASRLHRELHIDWEGVALAINLIDKLEALRDENRQLRQQLARFCPEI